MQRETHNIQTTTRDVKNRQKGKRGQTGFPMELEHPFTTMPSSRSYFTKEERALFRFATCLCDKSIHVRRPIAEQHGVGRLAHLPIHIDVLFCNLVAENERKEERWGG